MRGQHELLVAADAYGSTLLHEATIDLVSAQMKCLKCQ